MHTWSSDIEARGGERLRGSGADLSLGGERSNFSPMCGGG